VDEKELERLDEIDDVIRTNRMVCCFVILGLLAFCGVLGWLIWELAAR
jgi:predicted negative regulator of RcsB-dependent stress response